MSPLCLARVRKLAVGVMMALLALPRVAPAASTQEWQVVKSTHFIVMHTGDEPFANSVSDKAESYYTAIAADLGFTRYQNFWVWDNRVKILIYPTARAFADACQAPVWATGRASYERHEIASYPQSGAGFLTSLLPHELSHLILSDFMGHDRVPLWLTEGFAQWEQEGRKSSGFRQGLGFKLKELMVADIRQDPDQQRVAVFYAQSASVVGFMITMYGGPRFGSFCKALRDGKTVDAALTSVYSSDLPSVEAMEQKWLKSLR
ncbi:MAG: hypothetical protein WCS52_05840 [bacterium]